jgi:hypothetical protein
MSNNIIDFPQDEDDDPTVFQTDTELKKINRDIFGDIGDDDVDPTIELSAKKQSSYWQTVFG